jgi:DHA1 family bicyclomycin/chloramphenicol resistance-like MFS transporter
MTTPHAATGAASHKLTESAMPRVWVVLILALLLGIQPVTTDLYLPALPTLTEGFAASMPQAQLTLTALLLAFGLSQLLWGPLSDRFGRRPVLLWGMGAYGLASVGCALAPSMDMLILWRTLQGVAMGAAVMAARAVVRDLYQPLEGARVMSQALTGLGVIACACAPLGGLLTDHWGWRPALMVLALFGLVTWVLLALKFKETLAQANPRALEPVALIKAWGVILRNPTFRAYCALSSASYLGLFTFLAASSFVFVRQFGLSKTHYGLLMLSMSFSYIVGTFICRWLLLRMSVQKCVALASCFTLAGGISLTVLAYAGQDQSWYGPWAVMGPVYLFMLAHGVHQPCGQSGAVAPFPRMAGTASALNGFLMMLGAFFMGGWLGSHMAQPSLALAHGMLLWSLCIGLLAWTWVRRLPALGK